jgi:proline iminopeptidase
MIKTMIIRLAVIAQLAFSGNLAAQQATFWLKNNNAKMPVAVRGNVQSNMLIVFLHGGPGGTALKKIGTRAFNKLEEDFGVVYWDQRGADKANGGIKKHYMNTYQFVEDLDKLIDQIQILYPSSSLFLMGHCWGGALATAYLADEQRQKKIAGWIMVGGAYNNPRGDSLSMVWVKAHAQKMIAEGKDSPYWKKAMKWYAKNPFFSSAQLRHYTFVRKAHGYQLVKGDSLGPFPCYTQKDMLKAPNRYIGYYLNYYRTLLRFIISDIDLSGDLYKIKIPTLILWGLEDGLVPVTLGQESFDLMGAEDKFLILYEGVAHTVYYEHPVPFARDVGRFIMRFTPGPVQPVAMKFVGL